MKIFFVLIEKLNIFQEHLDSRNMELLINGKSNANKKDVITCL